MPYWGMAHHTLLPVRYQYTFGPHAPSLVVADGDSLTAKTRDCRGQDADREPLPETMVPPLPGGEFQRSNPVVGPILVEEARRGDSLCIRIDRIRIDRDYGMSKQTSRFGSLTGEWPGHPMQYPAPIETRFFDWKIDPERLVGTLLLPESRLGKVEVPLSPFIGSIGVAPPMGRVETTLTPGEFGGNMDYRGLTEGVALHLPVWVDGAYLAFGDVHALQGDGETNGTAVEVSAEVTLTVTVEKKPEDRVAAGRKRRVHHRARLGPSAGGLRPARDVRAARLARRRLRLRPGRGLATARPTGPPRHRQRGGPAVYGGGEVPQTVPAALSPHWAFGHAPATSPNPIPARVERPTTRAT